MEVGRKKTAGEAGHRVAGGEGGAGTISVRNNKRQILGLGWSMSKVGTPPPHNLENPHGMVASTNNNNNIYVQQDISQNSEPVRI